jgi:putative component of membrane protein insertase Oxa1/YidC/SpoIIIJ protein YidD
MWNSFRNIYLDDLAQSPQAILEVTMSFPRRRESNKYSLNIDARFHGYDKYYSQFMCIILIFFLLAPSLYSQTDWQRWEKAEVNYEIKKVEFPEETKNENGGIITSILSLTRKVYAFFISDVDGDNCPFYPSCSNFYVKSVKAEGIIKGTLMFADRFTRDMNFLKSTDHYPRHYTGRFYDPPENYTLNMDRILYYPSETTVKK